MKIPSAPLRYFWAITAAVLFSSCQANVLKYPDSYDSRLHAEDKANYLLGMIKNRNNKLGTFKGIGNLKLVDTSKTMNLRAAWMGTKQGKFRVEIFGFPGQSAASYSNDGHSSYLYLPMENRFYIIDDDNPSLEKILTISITSNDLNAFLSGRIPMDAYETNRINLQLRENEYELILKKGCFKDKRKIYIDKLDNDVRKVEVFNMFGSLKYRVELNKVQSVNEYNIPFEIIISNDDGNRLHIYIDKYWTDDPVPPSSFTLTPPN